MNRSQNRIKRTGAKQYTIQSDRTGSKTGFKYTETQVGHMRPTSEVGKGRIGEAHQGNQKGGEKQAHQDNCEGKNTSNHRKQFTKYKNRHHDKQGTKYTKS